MRAKARAMLEGYDAMWPLVDSQIDPNVKYPEKMPLDRLIEEICRPFGFTDFAIDNAANVDIATRRKAGKKRRHRKTPRALNAYKLPKKKPEHNDTFFQFLSRFLNRVGLWMWPSVDGNVLIVSTPDYDQEPLYSLRLKFDGKNNNVLSGGIRKDATEQPTFIVATGKIPAKTVEHSRIRVVHDNPYVAGLELGLTMQEQDAKLGRNRSPTTGDIDSSLSGFIGPPRPSKPLPDKPFFSGIDSTESGTFVSTMQRYHTELVDKWTQTIPVQPIKTPVNVFAATVAKPRFLRDPDSHTLDELEHFARRQMSLCTRKACVGRYLVPGFKIGDVPIQVDTMMDVDDDVSRWRGSMWVSGRTFHISRGGGTTTSLELLPPGAIVF